MIHHSWCHHSSHAPPEVPMGGDFLGLSATFHPQTGALIPIPEYMIPKSLVQWGQAPTSLQVFASEDIDPNDGSSPQHLRRQTWTMYPETDCGMENIQTHRVAPVQQFVEHVVSNRLTAAIKNDDGDINSTRRRRNDDIPSATARVWTDHLPTTDAASNTVIIVESAFVAFAKNDDQHRIRMAVQVEIDERHDGTNSHNNTTSLSSSATSSYNIVSPVKIILERRLDPVATFGSHFTKGGGLHAAQLTRWMGPMLPKYESFAGNPMGGKWRRNSPSGEGMLQSPEIMFPGHLTLSYGTLGTLWILEMGQIVPEDQIQHLVRLSFHSPSAVEIETWVEPGEFAS